MTVVAVALGLAVSIVALVARDVALRALAAWAGRGEARSEKRMALVEARVQAALDLCDHNADLTERVEAVEEYIAARKMREALGKR